MNLKAYKLSNLKKEKEKHRKKTKRKDSQSAVEQIKLNNIRGTVI